MNKAIVIAFITCLLCACGQKGKLYHPEDTPQYPSRKQEQQRANQ